MIDPLNITDFVRTKSQLEEFILNAIAFAGKNARQQAAKMDVLFSNKNRSPFGMIRAWHQKQVLVEKLREVRIGKYGLLAKAVTGLAHSDINLAICTIESLEKFPGIGPKTARFFVLHSRPNEECAVIDTHILKEMRLLKMTTLRYTPTGKKYSQLESLFINHLKKSGVTDFAEYDLAVWKKYALKSAV